MQALKERPVSAVRSNTSHVLDRTIFPVGEGAAEGSQHKFTKSSQNGSKINSRETASLLLCFS